MKIRRIEALAGIIAVGSAWVSYFDERFLRAIVAMSLVMLMFMVGDFVDDATGNSQWTRHESATRKRKAKT
jgi:type IV secretory pathway VirB2 component (pilin)